jgi:hypothetical protein
VGVGWLVVEVEGKANRGRSTRLAITASNDKHKNAMFPIYVENKNTSPNTFKPHFCQDSEILA